MQHRLLHKPNASGPGVSNIKWTQHHRHLYEKVDPTAFLQKHKILPKHKPQLIFDYQISKIQRGSSYWVDSNKIYIEYRALESHIIHVHKTHCFSIYKKIYKKEEIYTQPNICIHEKIQYCCCGLLTIRRWLTFPPPFQLGPFLLKSP